MPGAYDIIPSSFPAVFAENKAHPERPHTPRPTSTISPARAASRALRIRHQATSRNHRLNSHSPEAPPRDEKQPPPQLPLFGGAARRREATTTSAPALRGAARRQAATHRLGSRSPQAPHATRRTTGVAKRPGFESTHAPVGSVLVARKARSVLTVWHARPIHSGPVARKGASIGLVARRDRTFWPCAPQSQNVSVLVAPHPGCSGRVAHKARSFCPYGPQGPVRSGPVARKGASIGLAARRARTISSLSASGPMRACPCGTRPGLFWPCGTQGCVYWPCGTQGEIVFVPECLGARSLLSLSASGARRFCSWGPQGRNALWPCGLQAAC